MIEAVLGMQPCQRCVISIKLQVSCEGMRAGEKSDHCINPALRWSGWTNSYQNKEQI